MGQSGTYEHILGARSFGSISGILQSVYTSDFLLRRRRSSYTNGQADSSRDILSYIESCTAQTPLLYRKHADSFARRFQTCVIAAGETENPRLNIPKAVRRVFWRILIFYCLAIFMVTLCVSSEDPLLLDAIQKGKPGVAASPFVIAIKRAGINALPDIINAVVLTSAWSAGNSFYYTSTRVLYASAVDGKAPKFFTYEKFGVPYACVGMTTAVGCLSYLNVSNSSSEVFFWFSNISAVSTLLVWCSICITYLRFYYGLRANGITRASLPWKSPFQPFLAYFAVCFCSIIAFFNGFDCFFPGNFSAKTFIPPYIGQ